MKPIDIILIIAIAVLIVGVIAYLIVKKKKGETGCGCACKGCPSAGACHLAKPSEQFPEKTEKNEEEGTHV